MSDDDLGARTGLPPALAALVADLPRSGWSAHPRFGGLAAFWLEKHLEFRRLCGLLERDLQARLDGRAAPETAARRLWQAGGMLVGGLHDHHGIEDHHYFPVMQELEPRLAQGFALLDGDHHALDPWLARLEAEIRAAAADPQDRDAAGRLLGSVEALSPFLSRHLEDEEDLVVPVILRHAM
ncbi:hemerythrin domain-containing protein [Mangrovicoccus algicola]|uniref:Hemerythrin domain-containing protein n=1 Tax=Mangrovicoccus algicola TaxID=2771008 RepID=A0A8J6Z7M4_9RHOB|nr:hemerythrin domain-containing protein [Mangrovicoccus algicola]MBE3639474.1 hemerythrin domain-containing protein [Mangrovicoccus algicola]